MSAWFDVGVLAGDDAPLIASYRTWLPGDERVVSTRVVDNRTVTFTVTEWDPIVIAAIWGDPLAAVALAFRHINPHWYLNGGDDDGGDQ
ncbi:hypothetical protein B5566_02560 [Mycobacterium sp. MHSD3]|nr:hypothetical protein B5566_02560 [Mycobacterium sp. MHSD3]